MRYGIILLSLFLSGCVINIPFSFFGVGEEVPVENTDTGAYTYPLTDGEYSFIVPLDPLPSP